MPLSSASRHTIHNSLCVFGKRFKCQCGEYVLVNMRLLAARTTDYGLRSANPVECKSQPRPHPVVVRPFKGILAIWVLGFVVGRFGCHCSVRPAVQI